MSEEKAHLLYYDFNLIKNDLQNALDRFNHHLSRTFL